MSKNSRKQIAKNLRTRSRGSTKFRHVKLISKTKEKIDILKIVIEFSPKYHKSIERYVHDKKFNEYFKKLVLKQFEKLKKRKRKNFLLSLTYIFKFSGNFTVNQYSLSIAKISSKQQMIMICDRLLNSFLKSVEEYQARGFEKIVVIGFTLKGYK